MRRMGLRRGTFLRWRYGGGPGTGACKPPAMERRVGKKSSWMRTRTPDSMAISHRGLGRRRGWDLGAAESQTTLCRIQDLVSGKGDHGAVFQGARGLVSQPGEKESPHDVRGCRESAAVAASDAVVLHETLRGWETGMSGRGGDRWMA